jgi:hypothetical protein
VLTHTRTLKTVCCGDFKVLLAVLVIERVFHLAAKQFRA